MALTLSIKQKIYFAFAILLASAVLSALVYQRLGHNVTKSVQQNTQLIESLVLASQGIEGHIINAQHLTSQALTTPVDTLNRRFSSYLNQVQGIANFMIHNIHSDEESTYGMSDRALIFIELIGRIEILALEIVQQAAPIINVKTLTFSEINALSHLLQQQLLQLGRNTPNQFPALSQLGFNLSDSHLELIHENYLSALKAV